MSRPGPAGIRRYHLGPCGNRRGRCTRCARWRDWTGSALDRRGASVTYGQTTGHSSGRRTGRVVKPGTGRTDALLESLRGGGRVTAAAALMVSWVALLWVLEAVDVLSGQRLDSFGIVPRKASELVDIVPSAFTHFGFSHV